MSNHSLTLHFDLAEMLTKPNAREETWKYLEVHAGPDGYINVIRSFIANEDKRDSMLRFERYVKFCQLLVC